MGLRLGIGELLLVTLVSVLIFYLAFSQTKKEVELSLEIRIVSSDPEALVVLRPAGVATAKLVAEGSAVARKDAAETLERGPITLRLGDPGVPDVPGEGAIDVLAALQHVLESRASGRIDVTMRSVTPAEIPIRVDTVGTRRIGVAVMLPPHDLLPIDPMKPTVASPSSITVTGPASALAAYPNLRAEARVESQIAPTLAAGERRIDGIRVQLFSDGVPIDSSPFKIEPTTVAVTLHVADSDGTLLIPPSESTDANQLSLVLVHLAVWPGNLDLYEFSVPERDLVLTDIELRGPIETIRRIGRRELPIFAYVPISTTDIDNALRGNLDSGEVEFASWSWSLPPGVRVQRPGSTRSQFEARTAGERAPGGIRVTISRRPPAEP